MCTSFANAHALWRIIFAIPPNIDGSSGRVRKKNIASITYTSTRLGSLFVSPFPSSLTIKVDLFVLFLAPVIWQSVNGTGVRGYDRTVAVSRFCVIARTNSRPNISLVQRTSKIVWSFDLTLVLTASLAKFLILRHLIGLSKRLGSYLHSSWNWSLQIVPESTILVRSFCTSDEAAQPVVRQNNLSNKLSWNGLSVSSRAFMIFCRSELCLTILYAFNSCEGSSLVVKPAISSKHPTTAPLTVLVIVHRFLAFTHCVKAAIPVCLEAASLFSLF